MGRKWDKGECVIALMLDCVIVGVRYCGSKSLMEVNLRWELKWGVKRFALDNTTSFVLFNFHFNFLFNFHFSFLFASIVAMSKG